MAATAGRATSGADGEAGQPNRAPGAGQAGDAAGDLERPAGDADEDLTRPAPIQRGRYASMATVRSGVMLEVARSLSASRTWPHRQVAIDLKAQGAPGWAARLYASDAWDAVGEVLAGRADIAILNPACVLAAAARRHGGRPEDLAAIATIPSYDQLGIAVAERLGVSTIEELVRSRPAMSVSLRGGRPNHSVHPVLDDALAAAGTSLDDLRAWGCELRYDEGLAQEAVRTALMRDGAVDAVIDEGVYNWCATAVASGYRFLQFEPAVLDRLEAQGYRRSVLGRDLHPELPSDVRTVDFSGFLLYARADADDALVEAFCEALLESRERIGWEGGPSLPLERMVNDAVDAPRPIPFHPAAERAWRRHGLLREGSGGAAVPRGG